jgi:beta-galactosidase GanA
VGLVYSQQSAWFYGGDEAREKIDEPALGFYEALVEARIPFEMVHDRCLDAEHLAPFRTLILPNIAALSGDQCASLRGFVERGGGLVATYETSLYDEWGVRAQGLRPGLATSAPRMQAKTREQHAQFLFEFGKRSLNQLNASAASRL